MKAATLTRATLRTSRSLDFLSEKGLTTQIGHPREQWPLVALKELVDNSIDACEEAGIAPVVKVTMDENSLTIEDNGPGIAADIVKDVLDFDVRVSSREAYVSPTRGAQGNALKAIVAMPLRHLWARRAGRDRHRWLDPYHQLGPGSYPATADRRSRGKAEPA
ncbi:MAG: ATP-binding protein [Methyloceanibacter sp.]